VPGGELPGELTSPVVAVPVERLAEQEAVRGPSAWISGRKIRKLASFWPLGTMPNSAACLIELIVSPPALARPMILAFDIWAWRRSDEKSGVLSGCLASPSTLPPLCSTTLVMSRSSAAPNT
jgi:hypothetical protein